MTEHDLWYGTSGPKDASIVLVGESWGAEEDAAKQPFVGSSGTELTRMLAEAGIDRASYLATNVVAARPPNNEMWRFFHARSNDIPRTGGLQPTERVISEVRRLYRQIHERPRRLVIAVGSWSLWALSNTTRAEVLREYNSRKIPTELQPYSPTGIGKYRGSMLYMLRDRLSNSSETGTVPLLPLIHPAAIMRDWSQRAVTVHDLKSRVPMALRGDWRPQHPPIFYAPPTFDQCRNRLQLWLRMAEHTPITLVEDLETHAGLITVVGLADSPQFAMAIPFVRKSVDTGLDSFWTPDQEVVLLRLLRRINSHPNIFIRNQNFIYDTQYLQWWHGTTPRMDFDSMLAQNLLFPGTPKDLGYLSSLYCKYHWYWKDDGKEWDTRHTGLEDLLRYNCVDTTRTFEICESQEQIIRQMKQEPQWEIKKYQYDLALRMMARGVRIDTARRARYSAELAAALSALEERLEYLVPQSLVPTKSKVKWWRSATQTKYVFHELLGFSAVSHRKTGNTTVGKEALKSLAKKYPVWRRLFSLLDEYGSADNTATVIQMQLDNDGPGNFRARCAYNPAGAETHRYTSSKNVRGGGTNLQNLTKGEEE